mgnify:CR=1 FL=1
MNCLRVEHCSMCYNYKEYNDDTIYHPYDYFGRKQTRISKEMAKGNGKYIKGKGWQ